MDETKGGSAMRLLMHICCAPCANAPVELLRSEGVELTGFWYNPNIHPVTEYRARRDCLREYAKSIALPLVEKDEYGLREFCRAVADKIDSRCASCYEMRLYETAKTAKEQGFDAFTSSLFISPYQNHELMKAVAERAAEKYGVQFYYRDFRPLFFAGQERARALGFYMQKYCGCVFSEEERYLGGSKPRSEGFAPPRRAALEVRRVSDPAAYMPLLLEADPSGERVREYLRNADVYALREGETLLSLAVLVREDAKTVELKNLVTPEAHRGKGYATRLLKALCGTYRQKYERMLVGTTEGNIPFYVKRGFDRYVRTEKDFFLRYPQEVFDGGHRCADLHCYAKDLRKK